MTSKKETKQSSAALKFPERGQDDNSNRPRKTTCEDDSWEQETEGAGQKREKMGLEHSKTDHSIKNDKGNRAPPHIKKKETEKTNTVPNTEILY